MLIQTTDGIEVAKYDELQVSTDGGEFVHHCGIVLKADAAYAVNRCRSGSVLGRDGRILRFRIVRNDAIVYERN